MAAPETSAVDHGRITPGIIVNPPDPPPDVQPAVSILPPGRVVATVPTQLTVSAFRGEHFVWQPVQGTFDTRPIVTYSDTEVDFDTTSVRDHTGGGGTYSVTFATPGDHVVTAFCHTSTGQVIQASPLTVHVVAAVPPAFTIVNPVAGATVDLGEGNTSLDVHLTIPSGPPTPLTVTVAWDMQSAQEQTSATDYHRTIQLASMPLGARTIAVTVADNDGIGSTKPVTVTGRDVSPPLPAVLFPPASSNVPADTTGTGHAALAGTADDKQSGMVGGSASVAWAQSQTGTRTVATPGAPGDFRNWTANVPLTGFGAHTVFVWATDSAGNTSAPVPWPLTLISSFVPQTLQERLDAREYLAALLSFAQEQINVPGPPVAPLDTSILISVLTQPLDKLSQPLSAAADTGRTEINQLRVPIELLRARLKAMGVSTDPGAAAESAYRSAAYAALLAAAGTSYQELRLARGAPAATRAALAARLGIRLSATSPDQLDRLVLDNTALTEPALENLLGLPDTTASDPLRVLPTPLLLTWRLSALAALWAEQDQHPSPPRAFAVLADPDVINAGDVTPGPAGDPIRTLVGARVVQLTQFLSQLNGLRTGRDAPTALAAMQNLALPGVDLAALEAKDGQGVDISPDLAAAGLTRPGFTYLRRLARLAAAGPLTAAEWTDGEAIMIGAHKLALYPAWRAQENKFVLSPDFFVLGGAGPQVSPYRVDPQARIDWQSVLRSRIAQRQDVIDAIDRAVAETEQAALPILRDALLTDIASTVTTGDDPGEAMSALFQVDMLAGGNLRTTRIAQAIESVQSLLAAKRTGELATNHPAAGWIVKDPAGFTAAWSWMGEWTAWQAATTAFLFPERQLDPTLLSTGPTLPSAALLALFDGVRTAGQFNAEQAVQLAKTYLGNPAPFSYLDPHRSTAHLDDLRARSAAMTEPAGRETFWAVPMLLAQRLQAAGDYEAALDWYWILYAYDQPPVPPVNNRPSIFSKLFNEKAFAPNLTFLPGWTAGLNPFALVANRPMPYTRATLLAIIRCHLDFADSEFGRETDESVAHARSLYLTALRLLGTDALTPQTPTNPGEPPLAVPEIATLRARATAQLAKLRQGRNIAGMPRIQGAAAAAVSQPTPYRFKVLMDRAKQLTAQAVQVEAGYLAALEKYDDRNLRVFDAVKGIDLARAQVSLAATRVKEARDAVTAAVAQRTKADTMVATYRSLIAAGPNQYETNLLHEYSDMREIRNGIAMADTAIGIMQAASNASSLWDEVTSGGGKAALAFGISAATEIKGGLEIAQNDAEAQIQANQLMAGLEQRRQEWRVQQTSAQQDSLVAQAQVVTAGDQVAITQQEQSVASLQYDQAVATLNFLNAQFTNADLYLWMSNTLGGVYRYFLQQATATARLAQAQLAFERAEPAQTLIRNDYWQSPAELTAGGGAANRRGLTGAEQLSADLARLDDYAFSSERRRLNLSQTFSLARLLPVEFLDFRRTGILDFATPMALFDADFPGHYLRLIRQVRTSVVGLVQADRGIRATLTSNGISRVTTGRDGSFGDIVVRHDPTVVALTSPINASGVFELDTQSDMLLPFESSGVDTTWELRLPRAANPIDYSSLVDVLITIDYTALADEDYRRQVTTRLNANRDRGADRVFSLTRDFPDQWYDLNNPADPTRRSVTFTLADLDFPLGVDAPATTSLAVRLVSGQQVPDTVVTLVRGTTGGDATATGGIASTKRGNASAWIPLAGTSPVGDWQLGVGSAADPLFAAGALDDILIIVGWSGQAPVWPL